MDTYLFFESNKNILFVEVAVNDTLDVKTHLIFSENVLILIINFSKYYHGKYYNGKYYNSKYYNSKYNSKYNNQLNSRTLSLENGGK